MYELYDMDEMFQHSPEYKYSMLHERQYEQYGFARTSYRIYASRTGTSRIPAVCIRLSSVVGPT